MNLPPHRAALGCFLPHLSEGKQTRLMPGCYPCGSQQKERHPNKQTNPNTGNFFCCFTKIFESKGHPPSSLLRVVSFQHSRFKSGSEKWLQTTVSEAALRSEQFPVVPLANIFHLRQKSREARKWLVCSEVHFIKESWKHARTTE